MADSEGFGLRKTRVDLRTGIKTSVPNTEAEKAELRTLLDRTLAEDEAQEVENYDSESAAHRAYFRMMFRMNNRIRVLEGKSPITRAQFRAALKAEL